jgi:hypothetical protein
MPRSDASGIVQPPPLENARRGAYFESKPAIVLQSVRIEMCNPPEHGPARSSCKPTARAAARACIPLPGGQVTQV